MRKFCICKKGCMINHIISRNISWDCKTEHCLLFLISVSLAWLIRMSITLAMEKAIALLMQISYMWTCTCIRSLWEHLLCLFCLANKTHFYNRKMVFHCTITQCNNTSNLSHSQCKLLSKIDVNWTTLIGSECKNIGSPNQACQNAERGSL